MMKIELWMSKTPQMDYIEFQMDQHKNDQIEKLSWYTRAHYFLLHTKIIIFMRKKNRMSAQAFGGVIAWKICLNYSFKFICWFDACPTKIWWFFQCCKNSSPILSCECVATRRRQQKNRTTLINDKCLLFQNH